MAKKLVIVESPAKAKTIEKYLGSDFTVLASIGHIRDLPRSAKDVPEEYKGQAWARLGVDPENEFRPLYVVPYEKKEQIKKLKTALKGADELLLATDEDREGESISWHLKEVLAPKVPVKRMVFHEITKQAILDAAANTRELNMPLVDAQETRRILDRLFGYEVSPVLWKKVLTGLSAGRVQSVACRIIVDRERERMQFVAGTWWDIEGQFSANKSSPFPATLVAVDGNRLATGRDFDPDTGQVVTKDVATLDEPTVRELVENLDKVPFKVSSVKEKPESRRPAPPFMTSTLQQEGGRKLGWSAQKVMRVAQGLYETGHITYMRTDSTTLSASAIASAREQAAKLYGSEYVPDKPRSWDRKVKNAQEAHEAIRPAGDRFKTPDEVAGELNSEALRLYDLIWKRTIASQMADAKVLVVAARLTATARNNKQVEFAASGSTITFPGFLRAYVEGADDPDAELADREKFLPPLAEGQAVDAVSLEASSHTTSPPARFTEASLVKKLEELGVGRPSTYASIIGTIQDRGYAWKKGSALVPSWTAFAVVALLEGHFPELVDYAFTARLEDDLDDIANQDKERAKWLHDFYFGDKKDPGLKKMVSEHLDEIDPREINSIFIGADDNGEKIVARVGKYGPYLQRGEDRCSIPEDTPPDEMTVARAIELLSAPKGDDPIGTDPVSGLPVYAKTGRYGPYVQLGDAETLPEGEKPKMASLFQTMSISALKLEDALQLLSLPRTLGVDPETNEEITAQNGRYGPYLRKGSDSRSIENEEKLFTITLEQALEIYKQPKVFRRRGAAAKPPLRELGNDPKTEKPIVIKDGRYGPYITDGEYNATVPRSEGVEEITLELALELLEAKRAAGPPKKRAKKSAAKKSTAKKATKKKAATKKSAAKKTTAKKTVAKKSPTSDGVADVETEGVVE